MNRSTALASILLPVALCSCAAGPALVTRSGNSAFFGEAALSGSLESYRGCFVIVDGAGVRWSLILPANTKLTISAGATKLVSSSVVSVPSAKVRAEGGVVRENGRGWSDRNLDGISSPPLPRACRTNVFLVDKLTADLPG